jgi:flagellar protein FliL
MANKEKEHEEEGTPEGGEKKKSGKLLLIIIIVVLFLIIIIGGIIAFMMMGSHEAEGGEGAKTAKEAPAAEGGEKKATEGENKSTGSSGGLDTPSTEVGIMFPLELFTVNLLSESGRRYLKVEMNLELEGEELAVELEKKKPVLRDVIIRILSSKSLEEISTVKGKESLKEQIVSELNQRTKDGKIKNVYFVDFVVQ